MEAMHQPVHLAGSVLDRTRHVCAFFHTRDEEYRVLLPFVKEGFERGDKAFHITDPANIPEHLRQLQQAGVIDILHTHPLVIIGGTLQVNPFYIPPGEFIAELKGRQAQARMT